MPRPGLGNAKKSAGIHLVHIPASFERGGLRATNQQQTPGAAVWFRRSSLSTRRYWDCRATVRKYTGRSPYCTLTYGTPNVSVYHTAHRAYGTRKLPDTQHRIYRYTCATNGHPIRREPIKGIAPNTASHFSPLQVRC